MMLRSLFLLCLGAFGFSAELGLGPVPVSATSFTGTLGIANGGTGLTTIATGQLMYGAGTGSPGGDSAATRTANAMSVDANADATLTFGYGKFGFAASGTSTALYVAQASNYNSTNYALKQTSAGTTNLNAKTGNSILISQAGSTKVTINGVSMTAAAGVPFTDSDTTDASTAATGAIITPGGIAAGKMIIAGHSIAQGVTTTVTAAATTTLTSASVGIQIFTGATTQTVQLPLANIFGAGVAVQYTLINRSSGSVSWARAGSDTINGATSNVAVTTNTIGLIYSDGVSAWYTK